MKRRLFYLKLPTLIVLQLKYNYKPGFAFFGFGTSGGGGLDDDTNGGDVMAAVGGGGGGGGGGGTPPVTTEDPTLVAVGRGFGCGLVPRAFPVMTAVTPGFIVLLTVIRCTTLLSLTNFLTSCAF